MGRNKNAIVLSVEENRELIKNGCVTVKRNGFEIVIEVIEKQNGIMPTYSINIVNPYETVVTKTNFYE